MKTRPAIVLVGFRSAAITAALHLNLQVIIWSTKTIPKKYAQHVAPLISAKFPGTQSEFPTQVLAQLKNKSIKAVIATTENSVLPAALLCERLNLSGDSVHTAELCRDKFKMKLAAQRANIPITEFELIKKERFLADARNDTYADELINKLQLPIVIKPRSSSGSRGLHIAHTKAELTKLLTPGQLAERFILGIEISIESFVHKGKVIFHNITEYYAHHAINIIPASLDKSLQNDLLAFNQHVISTMGVTTGITHLEAFVTKDGIIFGEIAIRPPGGYLMNLLQLSYGFTPWETLLKLALGISVQLPSLPQNYSASWVIHPGAGTVKAVKNLDKIAALSSIKKISLRIKPGDVLRAREGAGHAYGHILFCAASRDDLVKDIERARQLLQIEFIGTCNET